MEIFQLHNGVSTPEPAYSADGPPTLDETRRVLHIPHVYCGACRKRIRGDAFPIPEADQLAGDHPLCVRLRDLNAWMAKEKKKIGKELVPIMRAGSVPRDHPIWVRVESSGTMTAGEFRALAEELRRELSLPHDRLILPGNRVGRLEVACTRVRIPDMNLGVLDDLPVVVTERVLDTLNDAGCTGYKVFPVTVTRTRGNRPIPLLFELQVTGRAGLPGADSGAWDLKECPVCRLVYPTSNLGGQFALDSAQYDGSDIFCFDYWPYVFVTPRFKEIVGQARFTGVVFRPTMIPWKDWLPGSDR